MESVSNRVCIIVEGLVGRILAIAAKHPHRLRFRAQQIFQIRLKSFGLKPILMAARIVTTAVKSLLPYLLLNRERPPKSQSANRKGNGRLPAYSPPNRLLSCPAGANSRDSDRRTLENQKIVPGPGHPPARQGRTAHCFSGRRRSWAAGPVPCVSEENRFQPGRGGNSQGCDDEPAKTKIRSDVSGPATTRRPRRPGL